MQLAHLHIHEFSLKLMFGEKSETKQFKFIYISIYNDHLGDSTSHFFENDYVY